MYNPYNKALVASENEIKSGYVTTRMNFQNNVLRKRSQSQKHRPSV